MPIVMVILTARNMVAVSNFWLKQLVLRPGKSGLLFMFIIQDSKETLMPML